MLIGLAIRDVVLIEGLDLAFGPGLTVLTGETGAGKSIILDALGLALGARGDAGLRPARRRPRRRRPRFSALCRTIRPGAYLAEKGACGRGCRTMIWCSGVSLAPTAEGRAFVNDQPTSIGVLRDLGAMLIEVHGQHETVGSSSTTAPTGRCSTPSAA